MAEEKEINDPNAMCLATATPDGKPSARILLLKSHDEKGFVFYTNSHSRKGQEISKNAYAALNFHWKTLTKQVRIEGVIEEIAPEESDAYFNTRPRGSRIGAWASKQSKTIENDGDLTQAIAAYEQEFEGQDIIPRPPHWKGFRVVPHSIEFWQAGDYRIHQRIIYTKTDNENWDTKRLYP